MALSKNSIGAVIFAIALSTTFREGDCIRCYVCNSLSNSDCENNWSNIQPIDCMNGTNVSGFGPSKIIPNLDQGLRYFSKDAHQTSARNISSACFKLVGIANNTQAVMRGCAQSKEIGQTFCDEIKVNKNITSCSICSDDGCNSSSTLSFKLFSMIFPLVIALYC